MLACGGGNASAVPSPPTGPTPSNPCTAALAGTPAASTGAGAVPKITGPDIHGRWRALGSLWAHEAAVRRGSRGLVSPTPRNLDAGEISVLQDEGDLVLPANAFDLAGLGVRFARNASRGFDLSPVDPAFQTPLGDRLALADDDGVETSLPFSFEFFGHSYTRVFVNSDGNLTFDEADRASTARDLARLLSGPPRLAPFLADLDPSAGGAVFAREGSGGLTVTWCAVPGFDRTETTTVQISLLSDASVEVRYDTAIGLGDASSAFRRDAPPASRLWT